MTRIDFLILANHAEVRDGLLNLLGGGWDNHTRLVVPGRPLPLSHFGVGVGVIIDWNDTNRPHVLNVRIETDDGREVAKIEGGLEVGRPPGIVPGSDQRAVIAFNADVQWPQAGGYRIVATLNGDAASAHTVPFRVHDRTAQA